MTETINRPPTTKKLYLITNDTSENVTLTSIKNESDTTKVPRVSMVHTGGKDGDYCAIPNCSNASDFSSNHMVVEGSDFKKIAFWCDSSKHELYYSLDATYAGKKAVRDSKQWEGVSLLLSAARASSVNVTFFPF